MPKGKKNKSSVNQSEFQSLVAKYQEGHAAAQVGWKPKLGFEGLCQLIAVETGVFEAKKGDFKGKKLPKICPVFRIEEEENDDYGRTFSMFYSPQAPGAFKYFFQSCTGKECPSDFAMAIQELTDLADEENGIFVNVTTGANGQYTNFNFEYAGSPDDDDQDDE